jgi:hypothetical protein
MTMASQKTGIDWPKAPSNPQSRSTAEPRRAAAAPQHGDEDGQAGGHRRQREGGRRALQTRSDGVL